jgi:hypothetical protein
MVATSRFAARGGHAIVMVAPEDRFRQTHQLVRLFPDRFELDELAVPRRTVRGRHVEVWRRGRSDHAVRRSGDDRMNASECHPPAVRRRLTGLISDRAGIAVRVRRLPVAPDGRYL